MATKELQTILSDGEITNIYLGGTTADDKVLKSSEVDAKVAVKTEVGFADYNDATTATTPISVTGGAGYVDLTNDGLGAFTNTAYLPSGVTKVWDSSTNKFDFSELSPGDMVDIRLDLTVTTTSPSQEVIVMLEMETDGSSPYDIPFVVSTYKSAGAQRLNRYNGVYMGATATTTDGAKFKISSDGNCTVVVNGWYCKILKNS